MSLKNHQSCLIKKEKKKLFTCCCSESDLTLNKTISRNCFWSINTDVGMTLGWRVEVLQTKSEVICSFTVNNNNTFGHLCEIYVHANF